MAVVRALFLILDNMTFEELLEQGRRVARNPDDVNEQLRVLVQDPRFCAMLGWLDQRREQFIEDGTSQKMAPHHGAMAHCAGSVFAYNQILAELRRLFDSRPKKKSQES